MSLVYIQTPPEADTRDDVREQQQKETKRNKGE
jgi:hypothetical protein